MPVRYAHLKCEEAALRYLGVLASEVADCLQQAFINIRKGDLRLSPLRPWDLDGQLFGKACGHLIYGSESPAGDTFVIAELLRDPDDDFL